MGHTILALFDAPHEGQLAIQALIDSGIPKDDMSLIMPDEKLHKGQDLNELDETRQSAKRVTTGMGLGAAAGSVPGAVVGAAVSAIPGVAPAALAGAGLGAIAGALGGSIIDIGLPDNQVEFYNQRLRDGHALLLVHVASELEDTVVTSLEERGALELAIVPNRDNPRRASEQLAKSEADRKQPLPPI